MGNQAQLENVKKLLQTSPQVTPAEREEWFSLLQFMNDKQLMELVEILESPVSVPGAVSVAPVPTSAIAPASNPSNSISEVLKRNTPVVSLPKSYQSTISPVSVMPKAEQPELTKPKVPVKPASLSPLVPKLEPKPNLVAKVSPVAKEAQVGAARLAQQQMVPEEVMPETKSLEDAGRLNVATLRGRGTVTVEAELVALCKKFGYFSVLFALEQSPLYKTYLTSGNSALQDHVTFEQAETKLSSSGQPYLTKPEFEEVNDLLQRLKHV